MVSISPNRLLVLVQILVVLVVCTSVAHPASAVPHHHEHDRSEVLPPSVYHTIVSDEKHVIKNPPRHAPHRGVHKWRAINSVAHHINEAYGNHDEEVSPEEFGRWYREHRPKYILDLMKIAKQDHVDINKDGRIEPFEMHHFQDLWGVNRHETYPIFTIYDNNADGYLDELEYAHFLNDKIDKQHFYQHMRLAMVREAFETLDPKREDRELYDNEILYSIQEVIRKEGYCEGENANDPKHEVICAADGADKLFEELGVDAYRAENGGHDEILATQDHFYNVAMTKNLEDFDVDSKHSFFWQRYLDHGWMNHLMGNMDHDNNGKWHLNNEMLRQHRGMGDPLHYGFDHHVRLSLEGGYLEHMFINYYADNKHRHWEEPDNPKWNKFSKKYYGLPQYEDDYTGHPDNIHLHDAYNTLEPLVSMEYFLQKYRNKNKKGLVLKTDDEEAKAQYLATLKDMRDKPENYEWGDVGSHPDNDAYYNDYGVGEDVRAKHKARKEGKDQEPQDNIPRGKDAALHTVGRKPQPKKAIVHDDLDALGSGKM